jgi:hypothetical protein
MNRLLSALSCAALVLGLSSTAAHAETIDGYTNFDLTSFSVTSAGGGIFNFSFSGSGQTGSGVFTTATTGTVGEYLITGITGTTDGSAIASLFPAFTYPNLLGGGDNDLFFPSIVTSPNVGPAFLDIFGLSYALANGKDINLYYGQGQTGDPEVYNLITGGTAPEPPSLLLLATGALGLAAFGLARRRLTPAAGTPAV